MRRTQTQRFAPERIHPERNNHELAQYARTQSEQQAHPARRVPFRRGLFRYFPVQPLQAKRLPENARRQSRFGFFIHLQDAAGLVRYAANALSNLR